MTRTTAVDEIQVRKQMLSFFETHSTKETAEHFGVTDQTIRKWKRRYVGTEESLIDRRRNQNRITEMSVLDDEKDALSTSLLKYNAPSRKRNVLEPTYHEVYEADERFQEKRSRAAFRKIANKLIGACYRKMVASDKNIERKHYHQAKTPGEVQIDKKYVPVSCFSEACSKPERIEELREQILRRAIRECNQTLRGLYADLERFPDLEKTIRYCIRETIRQYLLFRQDIVQANTHDLLKRGSISILPWMSAHDGHFG